MAPLKTRNGGGMKTVRLRPAEPERDFGQLVDWFAILEGVRTAESELKDYYERAKERILQRMAEEEPGAPVGFYWAERDRVEAGRFHVSLFVTPERRGQGVGRRLYEEMEEEARAAGARRLRVSVWDNCPQDRAFAERRGFAEQRHRLAMALDLEAFDDRPYDEVIARLKGEGFLFTSMEELGNTEEAQRKLYVLNETTGMEIPGADGERSWASFEDFQQSVCRADWYRPGGQKVVIDMTSGAWVAMSAITRFEGSEEAYNLHTGVDRLYRGRKLGQAVRVAALRYAREALKVRSVRTHHNAQNLPIIAISRKMGYVPMPGIYMMEKTLE